MLVTIILVVALLAVLIVSVACGIQNEVIDTLNVLDEVVDIIDTVEEED